MKILTIFGHPDLSKSQVSKTWLDLCEKHGGMTIHKLCEAHTNWQFHDLDKERKLLEEHDRIVLVFPIHWYIGPALMKKWLDDVWKDGWSYGAGGDKLKGKEFIVCVHCGSPAEIYRIGARNMNPVDDYLRYWQTTANMSGMNYRPGYHSYGVFQKNKEDFIREGEEMIRHITAKEYMNPRG